jgi:hypothetical protein
MLSINYRKLVNDLLPPRRRKSRHIDWLIVITSHIRTLYDEYLTYCDQKRYELQFNAQVINLESLLNDKYNNGQPGIFIDDNTKPDDVFLFNDEEQQAPVYLYNDEEAATPEIYLFNDEEYNTACDFIVNVPATISFDHAEMRALINKYRAYGFLFQIKTF